MKIKTSELKGVALDYAVAKCEYPHLIWGETIGLHHASRQIVIPEFEEPFCYYRPSTNWAQGGPIIEREKIIPYFNYPKDCWDASDGCSFLDKDQDGKECTILSWTDEKHFYGTTPLIAAMRCFVASKLSDEVEVPEELI